ncbi:hypothetical protein EV702DRAFT_1046711 [Suillus placidus]|uniref:Uncharacterized protein n=1 Tax=Suillus placidus TaxID=48579 RepID=A0A9P7D1R0_9AGAM|nr:hypothetical protein EV702DRAFT_1046711 [Suillus placidus]
MTSLNSTPTSSHSDPSGESESEDSGAQSLVHIDPSQPIPTSTKARAKRRIAALEDEIETLRQGRGTKQRKTTYYVAQGRVICRMVILYTSLEDLISENDCRYENMRLMDDVPSTQEQDNLQSGYLELARTLPWLHAKLGQLDHEECEDMLKKLKKGADAARGDDTSSLKDLVAGWVNQEFRPSPLIRSDDKHSRGFASDIFGMLLCPAEWDWDQTRVKAGIRDRTTEYIVSENSWPLFMYESYKVNRNNLEEGFLKSKLLVLAFKAIFTSPPSVKEADVDGDGADILENNRRTGQKSDQVKVKTCVASIINMRKVTPRSIAYIVCQVHFALSGVCLFEVVPGPVTRSRVDKLLQWWTRKLFGTNHRQDLTPEVVSQMSVNTLAEQRRMLEDAVFDSE